MRLQSNTPAPPSPCASVQSSRRPAAGGLRLFLLRAPSSTRSPPRPSASIGRRHPSSAPLLCIHRPAASLLRAPPLHPSAGGVHPPRPSSASIGRRCSLLSTVQHPAAGAYIFPNASSQENHFSLLQRETEKLRGDIDKMRSELKYEIDKVTAGQRLDLNLERGRIRDELAKQNEESTELTTKLDKEIHSLKAQLEAAKYDVIKYCIGSIVSISAVGLAVLRIVM